MRGPALLCIALSACTGNIEMTPTPVEPDAITVIAGAPLVPLTLPARNVAGEWTAPSALWSQAGAITVVDGEHVAQWTGSAFADVAVGAEGESHTLGSVKAMTRRGQGVLLATSEGLFQDAPGTLLASPASANLTMGSVRFINAFDDTLYVSATNELFRFIDGEKETFAITDAAEPGAVQAIVARGPTSALVVQGASAYGVDLAAHTVKTLARGVGTVTALDRSADAVLLGTSEGLVSVHADDTVTRHTFAAADDAARAVVDVEVAGGQVYVTLGDAVLRVSSTGAEALTALTAGAPDALALDANADAWVVDGAEVIKLGTSLTPTPPSFASDVKPFFATHCTQCHADNTLGTPQRDFTSFAVASAFATTIADRLTTTDSQRRMPPTDVEVLTADQTEVVLRWVAGGKNP